MIVQHSFGDPGSGGPITALGHILNSPLAKKYEFVRMHQPHGARAIDYRLLRRWIGLLTRVDPDLVHVRGLGNEGFRGALAAKIAGCPRVLVSIHGTVRDLRSTAPTLRRRGLISAIEPATLQMATHLITVSQSAAQREFLDPYRSKLVGVVPNGVNIPQDLGAHRTRMRARLGLTSAAVVCVVVGRLTLEKGHLILADALHMLPKPTNLAVLVVGDGPDREVIARAYAAVRGLNVRFLGRRLDVPAILEASDLFLLPTLHENLSNALLEAMAMRVPAIASAVGGNVEVLERGGGILVPSSDPLALANAIVKLSSNTGLREELGRQAQQVVQAYYTVEHMVAGLDVVYKAILHRGSVLH